MAAVPSGRWMGSLADRLEAWDVRDDVIDALRAANPAIPPELRDRQAETWWGLLAIADAAGEPWSIRARVAAVSLHTGRDAEDSMSLSVLLLSHIRRVFEEAATDRIPTIDLLRALVDLEEGPWARWWAADVEKSERPDGPPPRKAGADLSHKLKPFRRPDGKPIKPRVVRMPDGKTPRGYLVEDFADAFPRYLGPPDATDATDATALARDVALVASVASPGPKGDDDISWPCPEVRCPFGGRSLDALSHWRSGAIRSRRCVRMPEPALEGS